LEDSVVKDGKGGANPLTGLNFEGKVVFLYKFNELPLAWLGLPTRSRE
jgi:hypothetical protein